MQFIDIKTIHAKSAPKIDAATARVMQLVQSPQSRRNSLRFLPSQVPPRASGLRAPALYQNDLPHAEQARRELISLPSQPYFNQTDQEKIIKSVIESDGL